MPQHEEKSRMSQAGAVLLAGRLVLIVEDEPSIAEELAYMVARLGMAVLGPYPSVQKAVAALRGARPDCALLDINLNGGTSFPIAGELAERQVPFLFMSGYSRDILPAPFSTQPLLQKPMPLTQLRSALEALLR
jgi:DNA-binding response OmpR family regulator